MYRLPKDVDNKYRFVTLAAQRAEQLQMGARARVETTEHRKPTMIAQEEVATGLVEVWDPERAEAETAKPEGEGKE
jgi:DNA-directed RNA polymerase omega subunit